MPESPARLRPARLLLLLALPTTAWADKGAPETATAPVVRDDVFPLASVRPGMKGYGLTVTAGTKLERFDVEVVDVIHNHMPKQDVILVRCTGKVFERHGIAQGMSGSPVFIDGRNVGALAFTWGWLNEALGGITPIEGMLAEGQRASEGNPTGAMPPTPLRRRPPPLRLAPSNQDMKKIGTPVCVRGFGPEGRDAVAEILAPYGFDPRAVSGGLVTGAPAGWANLDAPVVPGSTLVVDLVRGDVGIAIVGTCTYVDGERIHAFGHDFMNLGETLFPMSVGYIYTIVPSQEIAFKLGASIREIGAIVQDKVTGVVGIRGKKAPMIPVDVNVRNAVTGRAETYHVEITANRQFMQQMLIVSLREIIGKAEGTLGVNTKSYTLSVKLKGVEKAWTYSDVVTSFDTGMSRLLVGLVDRVMNHPSQRAEFESFKLDVAIENRDRRCFIESATASKDEVQPGEEVELLMRMRRRDGGEIFYERASIVVPPEIGVGNFQVMVAGGDMVPAEVPSPVDIADIPTLYEGFYKSTELVALYATGRVNLDMGGRLLRNVPLSALPRLARSTDNVGARIQPVTKKVRRDVGYVVAGQATVSLRVVN